MMDEFERGLATAIRSAVPAPPTAIDPADITRTARRGRARALAGPLVTALVVAALAATVFALAHAGGGRPKQVAAPPATPTVSRQPSDLVGTWSLIDLRGLDGAAHTAPDATLTFHVHPDGTIGQGCGAARVTVGIGTLQFVQGWVTPVPTGCPNLGVQQSRFLFGQVLTGTATWEIRDGELTVHQDGAAAVFERVGDTLTAEQRALAVRIARTEAWASTPSGSSTASATGANGQPGWPPSVDRVSAIVTTHADAMQYVGAAGGDRTLVLVIRLVGDFSWDTPGPPGHGPASGNVMTIVVDAQTGEVTDTGLEQQNRPQPLPDATVLFAG